MAAAPLPPRLPEHEHYQPLSRRRRLLIVLLAISTAITVAWMLLERPGAPTLVRVVPARGGASAPVCGSETPNCVGGKAQVIVVPPAAPASR